MTWIYSDSRGHVFSGLNNTLYSHHHFEVKLLLTYYNLRVDKRISSLTAGVVHIRFFTFFIGILHISFTTC